jgi:hypothetical protein
MARLSGVSDSDAGVVTRAVYAAARRRVGQVPEPLRIMALNPAVMFASGGFEIAYGMASSLDQRIKDLATLKASMLVGCVF